MHYIATGVAAGNSREIFVEGINQLKLHIAGNHSTCTFHPRQKCDGSCDEKCRTRKCNCSPVGGQQCGVDGRPVQCFGSPKEPDCAGVLWSSKCWPIHCPYHLRLFQKELDSLAANVESILHPQLPGVLNHE